VKEKTVSPADELTWIGRAAAAVQFLLNRAREEHGEGDDVLASFWRSRTGGLWSKSAQRLVARFDPVHPGPRTTHRCRARTKTMM
jgi:hypothetical protein